MLVSGCSYGNLQETKEQAHNTFKNNGFNIIGYQGYELGFWGFNNYGGAAVWYTLQKKDSNIIFEASLQRWGNEYHIYNLKAIDAISPK